MKRTARRWLPREDKILKYWLRRPLRKSDRFALAYDLGRTEAAIRRRIQILRIEAGAINKNLERPHKKIPCLSCGKVFKSILSNGRLVKRICPECKSSESWDGLSWLT